MQTFWSLFVRLLGKSCTFVAKKNTKCKYVKMKKIFVMAVAALMAIGSVQAQEEWKNEIRAQLQKSVDGLTHHLPKQRLQNYKFYAKRENIVGIICF